MAKKKVEQKEGKKKFKFLTPDKKGEKYALELKNGMRVTNSYVPKKDVPFGDKEKAYRSGYLDAQRDNANAYKGRKVKERMEQLRPSFNGDEKALREAAKTQLRAENPKWKFDNWRKKGGKK